jgi:hypothetical protein
MTFEAFSKGYGGKNAYILENAIDRLSRAVGSVCFLFGNAETVVTMLKTTKLSSVPAVAGHSGNWPLRIDYFRQLGAC